MFPYNQQGTPAALLNTSSENYSQQWENCQHHWGNNNAATQFHPPVQNWPTQKPYQSMGPAQNWTKQFEVPQYQQFQSYPNSLSSQPIYNQISPHVINSSSYKLTANNHLQDKKQSTPSRAHHARISFVPTSSGGYKPILKRKRKRTMFTTEQIKALELVFQSKPYVTRDERQVLVNQLQLSDAAVKVWFQNRRLRGKRAAQEAAETTEQVAETSFHADFDAPEPSCSFYPDSTGSSTSTMSSLDFIESELFQRVDESGYITLDDNSIGDIVSLIDRSLPAEVRLD